MVWVSKTQTWKFFEHDFQDVRSSVFGDLEFALRVSRPKKTWEILGYGFEDMVLWTWDLNFGAWIFTLAVFKTET